MSGPFPYHQSNYYTWADGKTDFREFPAEYRDKRVYGGIMSSSKAGLPRSDWTNIAAR